MGKFESHFQSIKIITLITCLQTILFELFFDFGKHNAALAALNPFLEDPFDAVGSFAIQLSGAAAALALLRILRPYPPGVTLKNLALILNCNLTALLAILVTLIADSTALVRFYPKWVSFSAGWLLASLTCGLLAVTTVILQRILYIGWSLKWFTGLKNLPRTLAIGLAGMVVMAFYLPGWRRGIPGSIISAVVGMVFFFVITYLSTRMIFPQVRAPYEDLLDDLGAFYSWLKQHTLFLKSFYRRLEKIINHRGVQVLIQALNPRIHPWRLVVLLALILASALLLAEFIPEGVPAKGNQLLVYSVFMLIEISGALVGYKFFRKFLGII